MTLTSMVLTSLPASFFAVFGASFTRPAGPLGRTKMPLVSPETRAREIWLVTVALISILYLSSRNLRRKYVSVSCAWQLKQIGLTS